MLSPSSGTAHDYNQAIINGNQTHVRIVFPIQNVTITENGISANNGITLTQIANDTVDLTYGKATSTEIIINILNSNVFDGFNWEEEFHVDFGVDINGTTNWKTIGYFTGKKPTRTLNTEVIEFIAYDRMQKFDVPSDTFIAGLGSSVQLYSLFYSLCTHLGLSYKSISNTQYVPWAVYVNTSYLKRGHTCREILSYIAEAAGRFACINADGNVELRGYYGVSSVDPSYNIDSDMIFHIDLSDTYTEALDAVKYVNADDPSDYYIYPTNATSGNIYYVISNPLFMYNQENANYFTHNLYDNFASFVVGTHQGVYVPLSVETIGNWMVEIGDLINVFYYNYHTQSWGNYATPIMARTLKWNGGCIDVYECTGNLKREQPNFTSNSLSYNDSQMLITPDVNSTYWTVQSNASKAYGDLVVVNLRVAPKSNFSESSYLNITLPPPYNPNSMSSSSSLVAATNHRGYNVTLLANGGLYTTTSFSANTVIVFTFAYVSTESAISQFV